MENLDLNNAEQTSVAGDCDNAEQTSVASDCDNAWQAAIELHQQQQAAAAQAAADRRNAAIAAFLTRYDANPVQVTVAASNGVKLTASRAIRERDGKVVAAWSLVDASDDRIIVTVKTCPCKPTAYKGNAQFAHLKAGMTVAQAIADGVERAYVKWFAQRGAIELR